MCLLLAGFISLIAYMAFGQNGLLVSIIPAGFLAMIFALRNSMPREDEH